MPLYATPRYIHEPIAKFFERRNLTGLQFNKQIMPIYRYPDLWTAIEAAVPEHGRKTIDSQHHENLGELVVKRLRHHHRRLNAASGSSWPVGPRQNVFLSEERFWLARGPGGPSDVVIVRLRCDRYANLAILECARPDQAAADALIHQILETSRTQSVYRAQVVRFTIDTGQTDEVSDPERAPTARIVFDTSDPIDDADFIIDADTREMLWRNVVDLHARRDALSRLGVPMRRGVLLYGPPGTGKTYACRYLARRLPHATKIFASGEALMHVASVFSFARLMKPSCLFMEDADLVFASRHISGHTTPLGDLLDHMDGLRRDDDITVVITTNSLERIEEAIRNRPGRISQCIYFGPPHPDLRERYIRRYAEPHDVADVDVARLVEVSDGATQAFLQEWAYRAIQISSAENGSEGAGAAGAAGSAPIALTTEVYLTALAEMKRDSQFFGETLIGFRSGAARD